MQINLSSSLWFWNGFFSSPSFTRSYVQCAMRALTVVEIYLFSSLVCVVRVFHAKCLGIWCVCDETLLLHSIQTTYIGCLCHLILSSYIFCCFLVFRVVLDDENMCSKEDDSHDMILMCMQTTRAYSSKNVESHQYGRTAISI